MVVEIAIMIGISVMALYVLYLSFPESDEPKEEKQPDHRLSEYSDPILNELSQKYGGQVEKNKNKKALTKKRAAAKKKAEDLRKK